MRSNPPHSSRVTLQELHGEHRVALSGRGSFMVRSFVFHVEPPPRIMHKFSLCLSLPGRRIHGASRNPDSWPGCTLVGGDPEACVPPSPFGVSKIFEGPKHSQRCALSSVHSQHRPACPHGRCPLKTRICSVTKHIQTIHT